ncbi:MAG: cupin domain-containing protein [Candidatus Thorarchaeota archaeon]
MVKIYKASDSEGIQKKGYTAKYVADVEFRESLDSAGFILVAVQPGEITEPHAHGELEEVFVALSGLKIKIDSTDYELEKGDVALVYPNESHSFEAYTDSPALFLAIKFPNLKNDKVSPINQ